MNDIITFLEELATYSHFSLQAEKLIADQPTEIKKAYQSNNNEPLLKQICNKNYISNPTEVVQF